jgi:flagellar biosynthesis/type III secretory pathway chaperone
MVTRSKVNELVNVLEDVLVREFRASQSLYTLTKDERVALSNNDVAALSTLIERKEALLDELGQLDDARRAATQDLKLVLGLAVHTPSLSDVIAVLDPEPAGRLAHLRSGILTLMDKIRELTHGNRALTSAALERTDAVQAFLLSLYQQPAPTYRPHGIPAPNTPSLAVDSITLRENAA